MPVETRPWNGLDLFLFLGRTGLIVFNDGKCYSSLYGCIKKVDVGCMVYFYLLSTICVCQIREVR